MIIDLILDRKDDEADVAAGTIYVSDKKINDHYVPITEAYPDKEIPANVRDKFVWKYNPRVFYFDVLGYGKIGDRITRAMDYGEEADVKAALCAYIDEQDYNPAIKDYINSVNWL